MSSSSSVPRVLGRIIISCLLLFTVGSGAVHGEDSPETEAVAGSESVETVTPTAVEAPTDGDLADIMGDQRDLRRFTLAMPVTEQGEVSTEVRNSLIFTGIVYGILICLALVNVRLAFWDHDRVFLYAAGSAACVTFLFALVDGYVPQIFSLVGILETSPDRILADLAFLCLIPYILWSRKMLDVTAHYRWLGVSMAVGVVMIVVISAASMAMIAPINERVIGWVALAILVSIIGLAVWFQKKGEHAAGTVLAVAITIAVFVFAQTMMPGLDEFENIRFPLLKAGTIIALLLMTAGMVSDRDIEFRKDYRLIKSKVDEAEKALGRNAELEKYNAELEKKNRERIEESAHFSKELDIVKNRVDYAHIRYQALLDDAPDAIFEVTGERAEIVQANIRAEELLRASRDELIGQSLFSFVPESRREFYQKVFQHHRESGVALEEAVELVRSDGVHIAIEAVPTYAEIGNQKVTQIYFRENVGMPELPEVRDEQRELLEYAIEEAEIICGVFQRDGKVGLWNGYAEKFTGYSRQDIERIGWNGFVTAILPEPEQRSLFMEAFALSSEREANKEFLLRLRSGEDKTVRIMTRPLRNEAGGITGQVLFGLDLSRQKRLERDLAKFRETEKDKNERLSALLQEQRVLSERYARLLSMVCKDIRQALGTVNAQSRAGTLSAESTVLKEAIGLVDDCISNEVQERTRNEPAMESCDLVRIANEAIVKNRPAAQAKSIVIRTEFPPTLFTRVDPQKMVAVFSELVENAIKFSPYESSISVQISRPSGMKYARFLVKDAGAGLDEDARAKIFDPFSGVSTKPTAGEPHVGLGLTVAKILVQQHKGTIDVHSEGDGSGSSFIVSLPLAI